MKSLIAVLALAGFAAAPALAQDDTEYPRLNPGEWRATTTMTMSGPMPMGPETETDTSCITEEDAEFDPRELLELEDDSCSIDNLQTTSTRVSFDMLCNSEGVTMAGQAAFDVGDGGDSLDGGMEMSGSIPGLDMPPIVVNVTIASTRVGACTSEES